MAIAKFNPSFKPLRGKVGGLVFKHYADKVVVTRAPTFSGQWSPAQKDGRKRFALASAYARTVCADPSLRAKYEKIAARRGLTVRSVVISAYLQGTVAKIEAFPRPASQLRLVWAKTLGNYSLYATRCRFEDRLSWRQLHHGLQKNKPRATAIDRRPPKDYSGAYSQEPGYDVVA